MIRRSSRSRGRGGSEPAAAKKRAPAPPPQPPPREPTPPITPTQPRLSDFPCAICQCYELPSDQLVSCRDCRLTVHPSCYGLNDVYAGKWSCDMCQNDRRETAGFVSSSIDPASYEYKCVLCPVEQSSIDMVEPPKVSHKKKSEREREKERMEKDLAVRMAESYQKAQQEKGKPPIPREPLKRTANNNWVHVTCAIFTPEVKFSNAKSLEGAEGIPWIPKPRWEQVCKLCKNNSKGACVSCHQCHATFHVGCAHQAQYVFGFDVQPVKSSRRDGVNIVTFGVEDDKRETGTVTAVIWCKEHETSIKTIVHPMQEEVDGPCRTALQKFVRNYKQADLTLTGTMRKANLLDEFNKATASVPVATSINRRISTVTVRSGGRNSSAGLPLHHENRDLESGNNTSQNDKTEPQCLICGSKASPRWQKLDASAVAASLFNHRPPSPESSRLTNGVKYETPANQDPFMPMEGIQLANGIMTERSTLTSSPVIENDTVGSTALPANEPVFECNKCHWLRINAPDELHRRTPKSDELDGDGSESTPRRPPAPTLWAPPVSTTLHRPPLISEWQHAMPLQDQLFSVMHTAPPMHAAPPMPQMASIPPIPPTAYAMPPNRPGLMGHNISQLHLQTSTLASGLPNGLSSPHVPLGSPTHPPPLNGPPRPVDGPFVTSQHMAGYGQPRGIPVPPLSAPRPTTPRDASASNSGLRPAHGASASPNVRNLIDD